MNAAVRAVARTALSKGMRVIGVHRGYNGLLKMCIRDRINGVLLMLARNSCIPALAILLPFAKGNVKKGIGWWCAGIVKCWRTKTSLRLSTRKLWLNSAHVH